MTRLMQFLQRLLAAVREQRAEDDLAREIQAHLALLEQKYLRDGMSPDEARIAARIAFGSVDETKERHRDERSFRWFDDAKRDVAYALRSLMKSPAFTFAAVLTLAIGIGATTAIYSVVDRVLLQPLPFPDSDRLIRIAENQPTPGIPAITYHEYLDWRSRTTRLSGLAAVGYTPQAMMATGEGTFRMAGGLVSTNYFEVVGVQAMLGRTIVSNDDLDTDVMVLTFETWQRHFQADPEIVGTPVAVRTGGSKRLLTVVGVLPEGLEQFVPSVDFYTPMVVSPDSRSGISLMIGRLGDGVALAAASEEANTIGEALRPPRPATAGPLTGPRIQAEPLKDRIVAALKPALRIFLAAVVAILMIACVNVANLLLARGSARQREIAVRLAIGASRGRIVRQVLTECFVLASLGGLLGAALGAGGVYLVKSLSTVESEGIFRLVFSQTILPRANEVSVDIRMFVIAFALTVLTSVIFGVLPALRLSKTDHLQAIGSRGSSAARHDTRLRSMLVVGQLAMATALLIGAGLLAHSFLNLSRVEKGYDARGALAFQLVLPADYSTVRKGDTIEGLLKRLRLTPGVEAAGFAYAGILLGVEDMAGTWVPPGRTREELQFELSKPRLKSLSPGYLEAMGVTLLAGRHLDVRDWATAAPSVVINRSVGRQLFGELDPIGASLAWHGGRGEPLLVTVVGVVEDVRQGAIDKAPYSEIFMDYRQVIAAQQRRGAPTPMVEQLGFGFLSFGIRTAGDPKDAIPMVRKAVKDQDPNAGIDAIVPMEQLVSNSVARQRFYAVVLSVFAGVAGLLAAIGIYGVLAYTVVQRTQEIGVRIALGAQRGQVQGLLLRQGLVMAAIGIGLGLVLATVGVRYMTGMLFGLEPLDMTTFAAVGTAFAAITGMASYLPARRATHVDPVVALRFE